MAASRRPGVRAGALAWMGLWVTLPAAGPAPEPPGRVDIGRSGWTAGRTASAAADTVELLVVSERSWSPAVAVTLSFPGGYGDDPPGAEGTAWLLGMVLERAARAHLAETGAQASIEVGHARTWVTLLATSSDWTTAYRALTRTLLADPLDPALAAEARADLSAQLFFQRDAPVRAYEMETRRMLLGTEHARPRMGSPPSVSGLTAATLETARGRTYRPEGARVAVVGAATPDQAAALVGARRTMASRAGGAWVVEGAPPSPGPAGRAWQQGGRHPVGDEITNTWILAAYPFPGAAARIPMEFVAHLVADGLVSDPPAPGLISQRVEVRELPGGPVLLVTVSAESHAAANWEQRVARVVAGLAARPLTRDFMNRHRRSFRSAKALEVADPEREGRRLLTELEATGGLAEPSPALAGLSPEEVQRAVADLGEPRVLVYGPGEPPS